MSVEKLRSLVNDTPYGDRYVHVIKDCENPDREYYVSIIKTLNGMHCGKPIALVVSKYIQELDKQAEVSTVKVNDETPTETKKSKKKEGSLATRIKDSFIGNSN